MEHQQAEAVKGGRGDEGGGIVPITTESQFHHGLSPDWTLS